MTTLPKHVFINCPFDDAFNPGFRSLVFSITACGFKARCSREMDDATETRIDKLYKIIGQCRLGVHDLSRTELDAVTGLPRFNMPFELGLFLGAKRYGGDDQKHKRCLILDTEQHRYQKFISDLAGVDPTPHGGDPRRMAQCARDWLNIVSPRVSIPPPAKLLGSYDRFFGGLTGLTAAAHLDEASLSYPDFERLVIAWVKQERRSGLLG